MNYFSSFAAVCIGITLVGAGCSSVATPKTESSAPVAAPAQAKFDGISPSEASRKINLTASNIIKINQHFSNQGDAMARQLGWGPDVAYDVVVRRFAPGYRADVEWKRFTSVKAGLATASSTGIEDRQYVGSIVDGALQDGHSISLPSLWTEGEHSAFGSGILWLSSDVYENIVKSKLSTLTVGVLDKNQYNAVKGSSMFTKTIEQIVRESLRPGQKDLTLTQADAPTVMSLNVNGSPVNVEVIVMHNWFADMVVLNNPQNPLVLRVTTKKIPGVNADGFFNYEVRAIEGITE